jgi:IclR family acetate operon transcriptional repressor
MTTNSAWQTNNVGSERDDAMTYEADPVPGGGTTRPPKDPIYRIASVDNALRLLWMFKEQSVWTVSDAADELGVARSTAHRLLAMLQHHGFVQQNASTKTYGLGRGLLEIGLAAIRDLKIRDIARPDLEQLVREVGETAHLIVLQGTRTLIVDAVESPQALRVGGRIGGSAPPNCTSAGKVLLAPMPAARVNALLGPDPLEQLTARSIGTLAELHRELEVVRGLGYARNLGEREAGTAAVSVAIPTSGDITPAAITINAPEIRMPDERIPELVQAARAAAERVARRLEEIT